MKTKTVYVVGGIILAVGLFFAGMKVGQAQTGPRMNNRNGQFQGQTAGRGGFGQGGMRGGAGFAIGEVLSKDDKSVTIKLANGGSQIVFLSASTTVMKSTQGSLSDLEAGKNVTIQGKTNSDGSITAQSIQLRPDGAPMMQVQIQR